MSLKKGQKVVKVTKNPRLHKTIELLATGMPLKDASKEAGYSCPQAASNAIREARKKFGDVMEKAGLTDEVLVKKYLVPLLHAEETQFFQHQGIVLDKRKVAALGIRHSALDTALKLKGAYPRNGSDDDRAGGNGLTQIVINVAVPGLERAQAVLTGEPGSDSAD